MQNDKEEPIPAFLKALTCYESNDFENNDDDGEDINDNEVASLQEK